MTIFILISGKRCSGKDTLAKYLSEHLNIASENISGFAFKLKEKYAQNFNISLDKILNDYSFKNQHRLNLIKFGTDEKEKYGQDIWVKRLIENMNEKNIVIVDPKGLNKILVPDTRFKYELFSPLFEKTVKIRIKCDDEIRKQRGWKYDHEIDSDISECDLDDVSDCFFDYIIDNSFDINFLKNQIKNIFIL